MLCIIINSAVIPLWNMMTWDQASGKGAICATCRGFFLAIICWLLTAAIQSSKVNIDTLGTNKLMLGRNLVTILSSDFIHHAYSKFIDKTTFDFSTLDSKIKLVENDLSGFSAAEQVSKATFHCATLFVLTFILQIGSGFSQEGN